ncbi:MAG TPA: carboxyl transferase domain-containing protein [Terriglobales bacterium]|nr:carboxyl transferase domain-containing protein [Terriglobales bacterium]
MRIQTLLIANRGEVAVRIARAAAELGIRTVAVFSEDDVQSLHIRKVDEAHPLRRKGAAAYLDVEQLLAVARAANCDAVHPGYGFLSENAHFARRCTEEGLRFVGPQADVLELFGDKVNTRTLAERQDVLVIPGTSQPTSLEEAKAFLDSLGAGGALMIKALAGGGGRGMRAVYRPEELADAYARCQSEARAAFGQDGVYVEQLIRRARHLEVQVVGDGLGGVTHLWERECTLQRRHQKLVEVAPSPGLPKKLRERMITVALRLARAVNYASLGTFEFLVDAEHLEDDAPFFFMEVNPRLQVEHTVTEELTSVDLVKTQLRLAGGLSLVELGLEPGALAEPSGFAIQLRINMETLGTTGDARPSGGTLTAFEPPSGPGIRVDTFAYTGYTPSPNFDSLLAKLIAHVPSGEYQEVLARAYRALCEFRIEGVQTNISFLQNLLRHEDVIAHRINTGFVEEHMQELHVSGADVHQQLYFSHAEEDGRNVNTPMAALWELQGPEGTVSITAPHRGMIVSVDVQVGDPVHTGQQVAVLEAMKMEFIVEAASSGVVRAVAASVGDTLSAGQALLFIEPADAAVMREEKTSVVDIDAIRPDLQEVRARHAIGLDELRPDAVERRRRNGQRTVRENIADLCDPGSFIEYGALTLAAQRSRRSLEELIKLSPADGLVAGVGNVNGALFPGEQSRCMVLAYDYTVFAGTQGIMNHKKTDRLLRLAQQWKLPIVLFAEGGGGRPGDTDWSGVAGLDNTTFINFAKLSGLVPLVGIVSGRCFAGNAALLGCCDVIIATRDATIGMGGPAMIEGGGLGVFAPEEVGPVGVQAPNGVIDLVAVDEAEAVRVAKQHLSYFQGPTADWACADQRLLRQLMPENRLRVYDIRMIIETLADQGSVLELRRQFGSGIITAFIRIEGRPFGVIANNPRHLGGAIDANAADKAARFMQLCDAFGLPILSLCDTPGFIVGPEAEKTATVRHVSRMFVTAGSLSVPFFSVVLRKGYGLGAQAMTGGSFHASFFTVAWPSGEFGAMGLEGAVRLGYRKELEAISDPQERQTRFEAMVDASYRQGKAINMASYMEIDDVIDPMETRHWIIQGLRSVPALIPKEGRRRPFVDTW